MCIPDINYNINTEINLNYGKLKRQSTQKYLYMYTLIDPMGQLSLFSTFYKEGKQ